MSAAAVMVPPSDPGATFRLSSPSRARQGLLGQLATNVRQSEFVGRQATVGSPVAVLSRVIPTGSHGGRSDPPYGPRGAGWPPTPSLVTAGARQGHYSGELGSPWRRVHQITSGRPPRPSLTPF